jgi:putative ABC transport system substrate-binding protein
MRRRNFIALLGGAAAWPLAARSQQPGMPTIGFLHPGSPRPNADFVTAFHQGLKEPGYVDGRNVSIEHRWAEGRYDRLPTLVAELVSRRVAVIIAGGGIFVGLAAKRVTATIPIVFVGAGDPVKLGLVPNLNRPEGNITGIVTLGVELLPKRLELLHELVPNDAPIGVLVNPSQPFVDIQLREVEDAARSLDERSPLSAPPAKASLMPHS